MQPEIVGKVDIDNSVYYELLDGEFRPIEADDYFAVYFEAAKMLGITSGELLVYAAWDGNAEEASDWIPQADSQYIWQDGTDDGEDWFFKDGIKLGSYYSSRGYTVVTRESDGQVWKLNNTVL